jgi:ACR3 family arsenite efflux pump ArsB
MIKKFAQHMRKYLIVYTFLSLLIGLIVGCKYIHFFKSNPKLVKNLIVTFAILTIYPSMVQLRTEELAKSAGRFKEISISIFFVFVVAPLLAMAFAKLFGDIDLSLGFVTSNIVPASSASIGFVLIAEGNIELATILAILSLLGSLPAIPMYLSFYASVSAVKVPIGKIVSAVIYTLVTPFIVGQITRWFLIYRKLRGLKGEERVKMARKIEGNLKPILSLATMITMLILIGLLVASKAEVVVEKPKIVAEIVILQSAMLFTLFGVITVIDKIFNVNYSNHMAVAFISATKNQSVAAAVAVMALSLKSAIVPALIPLIQAPIVIGYLHLHPWLERFFEFKS